MCPSGVHFLAEKEYEGGSSKSETSSEVAPGAYVHGARGGF
jgi:hypothetical protein